jgi:hypothetical protein
MSNYLPLFPTFFPKAYYSSPLPHGLEIRFPQPVWMAFKVTLAIVWLMVTFSVLDAHKLTYSSEGDTVM